jgi:hypothetical protein
MGRASRRKKNRSKPRALKVEESFTAGPMTVSRAGRYVQIKSSWPPGEHEKMKRRAREERPKLKEKIDADVARLLEIVRQYDPVPLIKTLYLKNGVLDAESYSEPTFEGSEAHVEYLQSLAVAVPQMGTAAPTDAAFDEMDGLVTRVFENVQWYFHFEFAEEKRKEWEYRVRFMSIMRFLKLRGASIEEHHRDLVRDLFSQYNDFLIRTVGITTDQIIAAFEEIERQFIEALNAQGESIVTGHAVHARFRKFVDERPDLDSKPLDELMREFDATVDPAERESMKAMFTIEAAHIQPNERVPTQLLDRLAAIPGENSGFLATKSDGWPLSDSVIYTKPIIKRDGNYYCCNPVLPFRKLDRIIESWIEEDQNYYRQTFAKKRGTFVEKTALRHFAKLLPNATVASNLFYTAPHGGEMRRFETDAVVTWDRALFIIEAKSSALDIPAKRGALAGLRDDVKDIVVDAFEQGLRTRRFIESAESVTFEDESGNPVMTVARRDFDDVFIVNVTLESLGFLTAGLHILKDMGLLTGEVWPWSVFVNDLRIISEILETGSDFVAMLRSRVRAPDLPQFEVADEADFLMAYLRDGVNLIDVDLSAVDMLNLHAYTDDLDRYYAFVAGDVSSGQKPRSTTPATIQRVVESVERQGRAGFLRVTLLLLGLNRSTMKWLAADLEHSMTNSLATGNRHQSQLSPPDTGTVLTLFTSRSWSRAEIDEKLAEVRFRKYDAHADRSVSVFIVPGTNGPSVVEYVIDDAKWEHDDALEADIQRRKISFIRQYVRTNGEPEPNVKCPCLSGKKFKSCCRDLLS